MLKIQCRSGGQVWPEILYTVPRHIEMILGCLGEKRALVGDRSLIEERCPGQVITVTVLPGEQYRLYLGIPPGMDREVCIVEHNGGLFYGDKQLFSLLSRIVAGDG